MLVAQPERAHRGHPARGTGSRAVAALSEHRDNPNYDRATDLGMFEDFYPDAAAAWR